MNKYDFDNYFIFEKLLLVFLVLLLGYVIYSAVDYEKNHVATEVSKHSVILEFLGDEKPRPVYVNDHGNIVKVWEPAK